MKVEAHQVCTPTAGGQVSGQRSWPGHRCHGLREGTGCEGVDFSPRSSRVAGIPGPGNVPQAVDIRIC